MTTLLKKLSNILRQATKLYQVTLKIDVNIMDRHNSLTTKRLKNIESYHPTVSHYRRAHAPNRRYLPSDVTIVDMYRQFIDSGKGSCSYINEFKRMNVSMTKLGH